MDWNPSGRELLGWDSFQDEIFPCGNFSNVISFGLIGVINNNI